MHVIKQSQQIYFITNVCAVYGLFDTTELCKFFVSTQRKDAVKLFSDSNSWRTAWGREQVCHRTRHIHNSFPSVDWAWSTPVLFFADCFAALSLQASGSSNFLQKRKPFSLIQFLWWNCALRVERTSGDPSHCPSFCKHKSWRWMKCSANLKNHRCLKHQYEWIIAFALSTLFTILLYDKIENNKKNLYSFYLVPNVANVERWLEIWK